MNLAQLCSTRIQDRQKALTDVVQAIREHRNLADQPLTLRGSAYARAVQELNIQTPGK
jgi:hypothetical protein